MNTCYAIMTLGLACGAQAAPMSETSAPSSQVSSRVRIIIGSTVFVATLSDSSTTRAFVAQLPLTLEMEDVNANEKAFRLAKSLPVDASNPGIIHSGDVMLYGPNTLVLFYKSFSTSYSYTRIGKVNDPSGLAAALGSGNVTVSFETMR